MQHTTAPYEIFSCKGAVARDLLLLGDCHREKNGSLFPCVCGACVAFCPRVWSVFINVMWVIVRLSSLTVIEWSNVKCRDVV